MPQADTLQRLRTLPSDERVPYALQLIARESSVTLLSVALEVLEGHTLPTEARGAFVHCYRQLAEHAPKRDIDGKMRAKIITLLASQAGDELLIAAVNSYGFSHGRQEVAGGLRATALVHLDVSDPDTAAWYAIKLLHDARYTSSMSGEPALTAARVLFAQERLQAIYGYLLSAPQPFIPEVIGECLRALSGLSRPLLEPLIERYRQADDTAVAALVDLLMAHTERDQFMPIIQELLEAADDALYQFITTALITSGSAVYQKLLLDLAHQPLSPGQREVLREVYALRLDDRRFAHALDLL